MSYNNILASYLKTACYFASEQANKDAIKANKKNVQKTTQDLIVKNKELFKSYELAGKRFQDTFDKMLIDGSCKKTHDVSKEYALKTLESALENTKVKVSFLGSVYITSSKGWVTLNKVTDTANKVFDAYRKIWDFSKKERARFKAIEAKINSFYETSTEASLITKIFNFIKSFLSINPYTPKFYWEENTRLSDHYTKKQWLYAFWYRILWDHPNDHYLARASNQPDVYYHK